MTTIEAGVPREDPANHTDAGAQTSATIDEIEERYQVDRGTTADHKGTPLTSGVIDEIDRQTQREMPALPNEQKSALMTRNTIDQIDSEAQSKVDDYSSGKPRRVIIRGQIIHD